MKHHPTRLACLLLLCIAITTVPAFADDAPVVEFDRWYVLFIDGQRSGYQHATQTRDGDRITSTTDLKVSIRRGSIALDVTQQSTFVETADGKPIEGTSLMSMGGAPMAAKYTFADDGITVEQGGQTETLEPIEGDWMPPAAIDRYVEQQMAAGAKTIDLRTVDFTLGLQAIEVTLTVLGEEQIEAFGKVVPAIVWDVSQSIAPGVQVRTYVDAQGKMIRDTTNLGGMKLETIAADEQLALTPFAPPELMAETLIRPSKPIDDPRRLRKAVYELSIDRREQGGPPLQLLRAGAQRVVFGDRDTAKVVVDLDEPTNPAADTPTDADRRATRFLDADDEKVRALTAEALADLPDDATAYDKALRLRGFVEGYVNAKDLSVGFATASDVARTAQGDCSEHAVLLAAMLRAAGIASRTVTGLIYVDEFLGQAGVFGFHMWTQAWLAPAPGSGDRWIDLDATLPEGVVFDAAHIAVSTSSMNDGQITNDLVAIAPLMGSLRIEVVEP